ncbi:hypothetical protein B2H86_15860 [Clostridium botulinum]|uniref:hypothetical protein n=1 Tax=Clostridium botulinum TaxID=1491 RepID=UPI000A16D35D|nr:hypothetical protein [Clostridium botulinum]OSA73807.1 hypothetical protein B2H86_15860 [Clostridium botulinum]
MAGFGDIKLNSLVKNDVFQKIGEYILWCCDKMSKNFENEDNKIQNNENRLRDHLLECYLDDTINRKNNDMMKFHFMPECPENYNNKDSKYIGRVDIKIVGQNEWFSNPKAAYFVECKRLDGNKKLNEEYVINGISRFVVNPPHYSSYYGKNYMLGFIIREMEIDKNVKKIEDIQNQNINIQNKCGLIKHINSIHHEYDCKYNMNHKVIELKHMFTNFTKVVS